MNYLLIGCVLTGIAAALFFAGIIALFYKGSTVKRIHAGNRSTEILASENDTKKIDDDWLFSDFHNKMYGVFFKNEDPEVIAMKMKIDTEKYYRSCALAKEDANLCKLIMDQIFAYLVFALSIVVSVFTSVYVMLFGIVFYFYFAMLPQQRLNSKAETMKRQIEDDLPGFLDLLKTELAVGMPVENAIRNICKKYPCLLSTEFEEAISDARLGAGSWQEAMERTAQKYDVDMLSDFVLDISTAYTKGVSIYDTVSRKADEIKQSHLLAVKERAGKLTNTMLLPMAVFQFLPMIMFILIPVMIQISSSL